MKTDKYTKVVLTLIAIGLFLNLAMYLRVTPAEADFNVLEADVVRTKRLEVMPTYLQGARKIVMQSGTIVIIDSTSSTSIQLAITSDSMEISDDENLAGFMVGVSENGGGYMHLNRGGSGIGNSRPRKTVSMHGRNENGGSIEVWNKTGEQVVTLGVDDYGNGEVGVYNRKGMGRVFNSK